MSYTDHRSPRDAKPNRIRRIFHKSSLSSLSSTGSGPFDMPVSPSSPRSPASVPPRPKRDPMDKLYDGNSFSSAYSGDHTSLKSPFTPSNVSSNRSSSIYSLESPVEPLAIHKPRSARQKPLPPPGVSSTCGICEMPLKYTLSNEPTVTLGCGHCVHNECFMNVSSQASDDSPSCGICDRLIKPADRELNRAAEFTSPGPDEPPVTPTQNIINMGSMLTPPSTGKSSVIRSRVLSASCVQPKQQIQAPDSLTIFAVPEQDSLSPDKRAVTFMAGIHVSEPIVPENSFRLSAADISASKYLTEELCSLTFMGTPLSKLPLGKLRLVDTLFVASSTSGWKRSHVYLFTNMLIICRTDADGNKIVKLTLSTQNIERVRIPLVDENLVLCISLATANRKELYLTADESQTLQRWQLALYHPEFEFPIAPRLSESQLPVKNIMSPVPLDLILCISLTDVADSVKVRFVLQAIHAVKSQMSFFDRLGIIFFSNSAMKSVPLQRKSWNKWDSISDVVASLGHHTNTQPFDYSDLLSACESMLTSHCATLSMASVVIVSDFKNTTLSYMPWTFVKAGTPINTIEIAPSASGTLSMISGRTGGRYLLLDKTQPLAGPLEELVGLEEKYFVKNCQLTIKVASGIKVTNVTGWKRCPAESCFPDDFPFGQKVPSASQPVQLANGDFVVDFGHVRYGDFRSVLVNLEVTDKDLLVEGATLPLAELLVTANDTLSMELEPQHRVETGFQITISSQSLTNRRLEVAYRTICANAVEVLERALWLLKTKSTRQAFELICKYLRGLKAQLSSISLESPQDSTLESINDFAHAIEKKFDSWCNEIIDPNADRLSTVMSMVDLVWVIGNGSSFTEATPLLAHFKD